eukprot:919426-Pyramimonas_sp.AAC.1
MPAACAGARSIDIASTTREDQSRPAEPPGTKRREAQARSISKRPTAPSRCALQLQQRLPLQGSN